MSWFSSQQSIPIDDKIAEASSELIPNGDIDLGKALEISDLIRSKQTQPKDAMRSLKKRFFNTKKNPNVQRSVLKLTDFCIKNGGEHFVKEISSKEFLDPIVSLLQNDTLNEEVNQQILELIQNWSLLFSKNPNLSYITVVYNNLQAKGVHKFPSIYTAEFNESFLESNVAPEWVDSDACMICSDLFTMINRKHHCRACGGVFCGKHTSHSLPLPEFGITIPVRVCDNCYEARKSKISSTSSTAHHSRRSHHKKSGSKKHAADEDEDDDLKRAIELSLKESGNSAPSVTGTGTASTTSGPSTLPQPISDNVTDDEDEEMKRAIEASLRDLNVNNNDTLESNAGINVAPTTMEEEDENPYSNFLPQASGSKSQIQHQQAPVAMPQASEPIQGAGPGPGPATVSDQITMTEEENINLFANLLERYKDPQSNNNIYQDDQIQTLHSNLMSLRPKLNKNINDTNIKYDAFSDMHSKIGTIMRLYDGILQAHMNNTMYGASQQQPTLAMPGTGFGQQQQQQPQQQYWQQQQQASAPPTPMAAAVQVRAPFPEPQYPAIDQQVQAGPESLQESVPVQQNRPEESTSSFQLPSYPPIGIETTTASSYPPQHQLQEEANYDFPQLPELPDLNDQTTGAQEQEEQEQQKKEERVEEAPLIDL